MRRPVGLADVGLDLDDPAGDPAVSRVVGDQPAAEQRPSCFERRAGQERPGERSARRQGRG
jgi:hypothetical protein